MQGCIIYNRSTMQKKEISYEINPDQNTNENGKDLLTFCKENNLVPVNHMKYKDIQCEGGLTYRKGVNWISQLDWALCSESLIDKIVEYKIERHKFTNGPCRIIN